MVRVRVRVRVSVSYHTTIAPALAVVVSRRKSVADGDAPRKGARL